MGVARALTSAAGREKRRRYSNPAGSRDEDDIDSMAKARDNKKGEESGELGKLTQGLPEIRGSEESVLRS